MAALTFSIRIRAPRARVWKILWDDTTYRQWTSVFAEGSHAESDWQEGSRVRFLGGQGQGLFSRIARLVPNELMIFEHLGEIRNGVEEIDGRWQGLFETYALFAEGDTTLLRVEVDMPDDYRKMFESIFPQALQKVKALAE